MSSGPCSLWRSSGDSIRTFLLVSGHLGILDWQMNHSTLCLCHDVVFSCGGGQTSPLSLLCSFAGVKNDTRQINRKKIKFIMYAWGICITVKNFDDSKVRQRILFWTKECYWVQACSARHTTGRLIWEMRCEGKEETLIGEPADREDGRIVPQNNHLIGVWMPDSFID